jgi:hypothetical protein
VRPKYAPQTNVTILYIHGRKCYENENEEVDAC